MFFDCFWPIIGVILGFLAFVVFLCAIVSVGFGAVVDSAGISCEALNGLVLWQAGPLCSYAVCVQ